MDWQIYKNIIRIDFYNMEYLVVYFLSQTLQMLQQQLCGYLKISKNLK